MDFSFDEAQNITDVVLVPLVPRTSTDKLAQRLGFIGPTHPEERNPWIEQG